MNLEELLTPPQKKRGPKPRPKSELAKIHAYSFSPEMSRFLDTIDHPGAYIKSLIVNSDEYKSHIKNIIID